MFISTSLNVLQELSSEDKQYYEREAEKQNVMESGSHDGDDVKILMSRGPGQRPPLGPDMDPHDERLAHRESAMVHGALMHQMMHGQTLHHGHPPHVTPQLGLAGHPYPHTPGSHHLGHQGQAYHGHQNTPYHPLPPGHRGHPSHYPPNHSSYHQGPML